MSIDYVHLYNMCGRKCVEVQYTKLVLNGEPVVENRGCLCCGIIVVLIA
jgi:hypothetical protein